MKQFHAALHRIGAHLLEEIAGEQHLGDARRWLPLAGGQLGIEIGEIGSEAGFPHACNLAPEGEAQPFPAPRHLKGCKTFRSTGPRGRGQKY